VFTLDGKYTSALIFVEDLEPSCLAQINRFCNHPAFTNPIAVMPDAHKGKGACIGFSMEVTDKVIPAVVGVDIGCGVHSLQVDARAFLDFQSWWREFDAEMRRGIPTGMFHHPELKWDVIRNFPWKEAQDQFNNFREAYSDRYGVTVNQVTYNEDFFRNLCKKIGANFDKVLLSLGTLGGGNHYIEIGRSEETGNYWVTIHSGSRNFGLRVAQYHQDKAQNRLKELRKQTEQKIREEILAKTDNRKERQRLIEEAKREAGTDVGVAVKDMEWLEGRKAVDYLTDMIFAQVFASFNRSLMLRSFGDALERVYPHGKFDLGWYIEGEKVVSVHNYIDFTDFIIRKGAIRSYKGERQIIPFNMRDGMLLCEGKSNPDANFTAPHGAGRIMTRTKAKEVVNLEKFREQMEGIFSTSVCKSTLDEAPDAYKDSELIELAIEPTCQVIEHIRPVFNAKDVSEDLSWKEKRIKQKKDRRAERKVKREAGRKAMEG
jgi:RNA-splicing ligase RtcB